MLRRRRSSLAPDDERVQSRRVKGEHTRIKFKMSPCPEPEAPRKKQLHVDLTDVKVNLQYEEASTATESPERLHEGSISPRPTHSINLRPSNMLEIQRHLTPQIAKQQLRIKEPPNSTGAENALEEPNEKQPPSAVIRSMWDNVVSWMKMAVDFIASDNPAEADPTDTTLSSYRKRSLKRPLGEEYSEGPSQKIAKLSFGEKTTDAQPKRKCGRKSRISFRPPQKSAFRSSDAGLGQILALEQSVHSPQHQSTKQGSMLFKSPTAILAQNLSGCLAIQSPQDAQTCNGTSFFTSTKKFHSINDGLNSILDETPNSTPRVVAGRKRIRRPVLREFYGNSVNSPNLDEGLRRSPRLAKRSTVPRKETTEESVAKIPLPPPPPPIPTAPPTPHIPPPPPTPRLPDFLAVDGGGEGVASELNEQRDLLQKMQHRLRTRMKKKGGVQTVHTKTNLTVNLDVKLKQWAEIQAHSRKITLEEFLSFAEQKKMEVQNTLETLQSETPNSMEAIVHIVEILQEASQWFPGGSKEMKDQLPLYKMLERRLETLNEYVQISSEMKGANISNSQQICHSGIHNLLAHVREEFDVKHRHWGAIVLTNAKSWAKLGLPVHCGLIEKSRQYLCSLVVRFVSLALEEAANIIGILVSIKSVRAIQAKERLKDSLSLLLDAEAYFSTHATCASDLDVLDSDASHQPLQSDYTQQLVLSLAIDVSLAHIRISMEQFEGDVCQGTRQEVCEHFECILKILNLLKTLASKVSDTETIRNSGVINSLQKADYLGSAVYSSCVKLIQHIAARAQIHVSQEDSKEGSNREVVLWMMFGCKYVNCTLEVLGSEEADERGVQMLLLDLQQMETLLPDL